MVVQAHPGAHQQFASFVGGQVMDGNALYSELSSLGLMHTQGFPELMPTTASFRIALREAYASMSIVTNTITTLLDPLHIFLGP